ncbi:MAG TPA: hypothetical protein VM324_11170 [Egibacteraceae bacterium]|nr:hypothetical protein [Egibacteraceae bacterium]
MRPPAAPARERGEQRDAPVTPSVLGRLSTGARTAHTVRLQRLAGNNAVAALLAPTAGVQRACAGGGSCSCEGRDEDRTGVQRMVVQRSPENEQRLADVQGKPMFALLPALAALDAAVLADTAAGEKVGGPRLVVAMAAVRAKGSWAAFAAAHAARLAELPADQIGDVMRFVGAPTEVKVYGGKEFDGRFDAFVEPVSGAITLIFKAKVVPVEANPPAKQEIATFKTEFKATVESTWSGKGTVAPSCPVLGTKAFTTRVVVHFVDGGEHLPITLYNASYAYGRVETDRATGARSAKLDAEAYKTSRRESYARGGGVPPMVSEQSTAAHEFGHAIGLDHVHCPGSDLRCYGMTPEEHGDVMGGGSKVQKITVPGPDGKPVIHDDFAPFVRIGERYGTDLFPGALATKCNKWESKGS